MTYKRADALHHGDRFVRLSDQTTLPEGAILTVRNVDTNHRLEDPFSTLSAAAQDKVYIDLECNGREYTIWMWPHAEVDVLP